MYEIVLNSFRQFAVLYRTMADEAAAQNLPHLETEHFEVFSTTRNNGRDWGGVKDGHRHHL